MGGNITRERPAVDEHTQFHIEGQGVFGQVGAGDKQQRLVGHGAFDVQRAVFAVLGLGAFVLRPDVDRGVLSHSLPQGSDRIVGHPAFAGFRRFDTDTDIDPAFGGLDQGLADVGDFVDGEANNEQPLPGGMDDLQQRLVGAAEGRSLARGAGPDQRHRLGPAPRFGGLGRGQERQGQALGGEVGAVALPDVQQVADLDS